MQPLAASPVPTRTAVPAGAVFLRDVDDLHDADLDQLLADRLAEPAGALRAVVIAARLAEQIAQPGTAPAAGRVHALPATAHRLVG
ncbi:hypothetical protein ACI792_10345 [Blastococcus sp. SYSU DS0669]